MTLLFDGGDGTGGQPDNLAGAATGTTDTSTFLQGSTSYTISASNARVGMMFDAGTAQDYSNNTFYITVNIGVVGLLDLQTNGGFRIRFANGTTAADFFEVDIGGSDVWPNSIQGGWVTFVVDIETAKADAGRITGGTEPPTTTIRYVGFSMLLITMPKMADNAWFDTLYRLPDGNPGIVIEGRNGGATDWNAADILTQLGTGQMFYFQGPGGSFVLNTPIQFGISDGTTHGFNDANVIWLWDKQEFVPDDLYSLSALGDVSGTTDVTFGVKTGSGVTSSGAQGFIIVSESTGPRWDMDFNDPDLDSIGFYGCSLQHGGAFTLNDIAAESVQSLYIDVTSVLASNSDLFIKNSFINSNTATDLGALTWDENQDPDGELDGNSFSKGTNSHHALTFGTNVPATMTLRSCDFAGFGNAGDATDSVFLFLDTTGNITLNLVGCTTDDTFSVDDAAGVVVTIVIDPVTTLVHIDDETGADLENARVIVEAADNNGDFPFEESVTITRSGTVATVTHTAHGLVTNEKVKIKGITDKIEDNNGVHTVTFISSTQYSFVTTDSGSTSYTGTIIATGVVIEGLTGANGDISVSRTFSASTLVTGRVRLSTTSPRYKTFPLDGTVNNTTGLTLNARLIRDD